MRILRVTVLLIAGLLNGCANDPDQCDPSLSDVGFITKFNCKFSGDYDRRIAEKQLQLDNERALNVHFNAVYDAIELEKLQTHQQVQKSKSTNVALQRSLNGLLSELRKKSQGEQQLESKIEEIQQQLKEFDESSEETIQAKQMDLEKLRKQVDGLHRALGLE